ncbi:MAG: TonB-dependent receptor [Bacteroidales bacterium]|nr:TonB-dependent receptor [Bacteroidales bacterium]
MNVRKILILIILVLEAPKVWSQAIRIAGHVRDSVTREVLVGAFVYDSTGRYYATTDKYGYFSMLVSSRSMFTVSYVGYQRKTFYVEQQDTLIDLVLTSYSEIEPVVVKADGMALQLNSFPGTERIFANKISQLPSLLGDPDITRTIQMLPGVNISSENSTGYFVHGGNFDQNLLLIDHIPIYQPSHMFGMFSIFNASSFNSAYLFKGSIPAQYGGRIASVLDIGLRNGNKNHFGGEATLSTFASRFLIEGPIIKNKTSFIITARRSMLDIEPTIIKNYTIFLTGMNRSYEQIQMDRYKFYDFSLKINHSFSRNSSISISYINSNDSYPTESIATNHTFQYKNRGVSAHWNIIVNSRFSSSVIAYHSAYTHSTIVGNKLYYRDEGIVALNYLDAKTSITENAVAWKTSLSFMDHFINFGIQLNQTEVVPLLKRFNYQQGADTAIIDKKRIDNISFYLSDEYRITKRLSIVPGLRIDHLTHVSRAPYIQPRFSATFKLSDMLCSKFSYCRTIQPIQQMISHFIQTGNLGIWLPSNDDLPVLVGNNISTGLEWNIGEVRLEIDAYYKSMQNIIALKEGISLLYDNIKLDQQIDKGKASAKGIEFSIHKDWGKTTGWLGYHLSSVRLKFSQIKEGKPYLAPYDRTHTINFVISQHLTPKITLGAQWIYATGIPISLYNARIYLAEPRFNSSGSTLTLEGYNGRQQTNALRFPAYHRLDLNFSYTKSYQRFKLTFQTGAYNAYGRNNAYKIIQSPEGISYIGLFKVVPYLSFSLKL